MSDDKEPQSEMTLDFHTDMPVGEILRRTRRHYGQSLDQIEQVLRIRASQLDALENAEIDKLPGRVYAIGFVRSYSEYLGLDGNKMVQLFKEQTVGRKQSKPELTFPVPASESKVPNLMIIGGSIFGVLVLIGFISFMMFPQAPKNEIPSVPTEMTGAELNDAPALVTEAPSDTVTTSAKSPVESTAAADDTRKSNRITLEITDASWIEIKNSTGAAILRQVLKPGDIYLVPDEKGLVMSTGNAGGITIKVDGNDVGPLGSNGEIRRRVALDADAFTRRTVPKTL